MGWAVPCWLVSFGDAHHTSGVSGCMLAVFLLQKLGKKKGEIPLRAVKVVEYVDDRMLESKENAFQVGCVPFC